MGNIAWSGKNLGCFIDGAFGHERTRAKLADLVRGTIRRIDHSGEIETGLELIAELESQPSDDLSEEDDAVSFLQDHTADGFIWEFNAGDLLLINEADAE